VRHLDPAQRMLHAGEVALRRKSEQPARRAVSAPLTASSSTRNSSELNGAYRVAPPRDLANSLSPLTEL
jgi:hypothetical protein